MLLDNGKWQYFIEFIYLKCINTMCVCITQSVMITSLHFQVLGMYRIWCGIGVSVFIYDMMRDKSDDIQIRRVRLISFKKLNYRLVQKNINKSILNSKANFMFFWKNKKWQESKLSIKAIYRKEELVYLPQF